MYFIYQKFFLIYLNLLLIYQTLNNFFVIQLLKVDPRTKEVVCALTLPTEKPRNMAWGKCSGAKTENLDCLYLTSASVKTRPNDYDGHIYEIQGLGSTGFLSNKLQIERVFGNVQSPHLVG